MINDTKAPTGGSRSPRSSREVALEIAKESDPNRLLDLAKELNEALLAEERHKVAMRMGRVPAPPLDPEL
jgi:hypothetical protein